MTDTDLHQATDVEIQQLAMLLQTHTALGRLALREVIDALNVARSSGYVIAKAAD